MRAMTPNRYRVLVDDNFHYMDEDERYEARAFETYTDAVEKCKEIVEQSLQEQLEPGMTAEQLFGAYRGCGDDPWVSETPEGVERFSARDYARRRSQELCADR